MWRLNCVFFSAFQIWFLFSGLTLTLSYFVLSSQLLSVPILSLPLSASIFYTFCSTLLSFYSDFLLLYFFFFFFWPQLWFPEFNIRVVGVSSCFSHPVYSVTSASCILKVSMCSVPAVLGWNWWLMRSFSALGIWRFPRKLLKEFFETSECNVFFPGWLFGNSESMFAELSHVSCAPHGHL